MKKTDESNKNQFFETLGTNQNLATTQGVLIQEKWLNISKNNELCGLLTYFSPISHFLAH